jgi:hypothetical protein
LEGALKAIRREPASFAMLKAPSIRERRFSRQEVRTHIGVNAQANFRPQAVTCSYAYPQEILEALAAIGSGFPAGRASLCCVAAKILLRKSQRMRKVRVLCAHTHLRSIPGVACEALKRNRRLYRTFRFGKRFSVRNTDKSA